MLLVFKADGKWSGYCFLILTALSGNLWESQYLSYYYTLPLCWLMYLTFAYLKKKLIVFVPKENNFFKSHI